MPHFNRICIFINCLQLSLTNFLFPYRTLFIKRKIHNKTRKIWICEQGSVWNAFFGICLILFYKCFSKKLWNWSIHKSVKLNIIKQWHKIKIIPKTLQIAKLDHDEHSQLSPEVKSYRLQLLRSQFELKQVNCKKIEIQDWKKYLQTIWTSLNWSI